MELETTLGIILVCTAVGVPLLALGMILVSWLNDRRSDAILRKLDDN